MKAKKIPEVKSRPGHFHCFPLFPVAGSGKNWKGRGLESTRLPIVPLTKSSAKINFNLTPKGCNRGKHAFDLTTELFN